MRNGWISLALFVSLAGLVFACGAPEITDLDPNPTGTTGTQSPTGTITGSPTTPPGTPTPSGSPVGTLPAGVPSFAMWQTNVYNVLPNSCASCHSGGSGGFAFFKPDNSESNRKYYWFTSLCNRDTNNVGGTGSDDEGVQAYGATPVGRLVEVMCGTCGAKCPGGHEGGNPGVTACNELREWLQTGTITPPSCNTTYDLDNSQ